MESTRSIRSHRLTFIGGGSFAQALISGICSTVNETDQFAVSITARRLEHVDELKEKYPEAVVTTNNLDPAIWSGANSNPSQVHILFICTRPMDVPGVCLELASMLKTLDEAARPTVVTMCPGILVKQLQSWLPKETPIVRCMPNTPVGCRQGATALFPSINALSRIDPVVAVIRAVSPAVCVLSDESLLDVVAAISG
jgi:pyrroline-5-carboxylate reductase